MAKVAGKTGKLYDGTAQIPITDWSLDESMGLEETSEMSDAAEEFTAIQTSAGISFNGFWDPSVSAHTGLVTKLRGGTEITVTMILSGTKGGGSAIGIYGTLVLDKFNRSVDKKGMLKFSASGKISGVPVDATNL